MAFVEILVGSAYKTVMYRKEKREAADKAEIS